MKLTTSRHRDRGRRHGPLGSLYRRLGLEIPAEADSEPHVDVDLGGLHLAFDTRETILSFNPAWTPPAEGHGMALAFACESPAEVDAAHADLTGAGATECAGALGRVLGDALRRRATTRTATRSTFRPRWA